MQLNGSLRHGITPWSAHRWVDSCLTNKNELLKSTTDTKTSDLMQPSYVDRPLSRPNQCQIWPFLQQRCHSLKPPPHYPSRFWWHLTFLSGFLVQGWLNLIQQSPLVTRLKIIPDNSRWKLPLWKALRHPSSVFPDAGFSHNFHVKMCVYLCVSTTSSFCSGFISSLEEPSMYISMDLGLLVI